MRAPKQSIPRPFRDERDPKRQKTQGARSQVSPHGPFQGFCILLVPGGVSAARLNVWRRRIEQLGGTVHVADAGVEGKDEWGSWKVSHIVAADCKFLEKRGWASISEGKANVASFQWLQDSLEAGRPLPVDRYPLSPSAPSTGAPRLPEAASQAPPPSAHSPSPPSPPSPTPASSLDSLTAPTTASSSYGHEERASTDTDADTGTGTGSGSGVSSGPTALASPGGAGEGQPAAAVERQRMWEEASPGMALYRPPDLNAGLTRQFKELMHIYRNALGDEHRWFSYYKAISAVEKLPFRVTDARQLADVGGVGASISAQVAEFLASGRIERLEALRSNEEVSGLAARG